MAVDKTAETMTFGSPLGQAPRRMDDQLAPGEDIEGNVVRKRLIVIGQDRITVNAKCTFVGGTCDMNIVPINPTGNPPSKMYDGDIDTPAGEQVAGRVVTTALTTAVEAQGQYTLEGEYYVDVVIDGGSATGTSTIDYVDVYVRP